LFDETLIKVRLREGLLLDIRFKEPVHCTGYFDGQGWHSCPYSNEGTKKCDFCRAKDISRLYTIADESGFKEIYNRIKNNEFSVYLALFGDKIKCGVTQSKRLWKRVKEQGARFFAEIMRFRDMKTAYGWEKYLQEFYGFKNSISFIDKLKDKDNVELLNQALTKIKEDFSEYILKDISIHHIPFKSFPNAKRVDYIKGRIVSLRSDIVFFKNNLIYYVPMKKMEGKTIEINKFV